MKKANRESANLSKAAENNSQCTTLETALKGKKVDNVNHWTTQFQASGSKSGSKV